MTDQGELVFARQATGDLARIALASIPLFVAALGVFILPFALTAYLISSALLARMDVPPWIIVTCVVATVIASLPIAYVIRNLGAAKRVVMDAVAAYCKWRRLDAEASLVRARADLEAMRQPTQYVETIAAVPTKFLNAQPRPSVTIVDPNPPTLDGALPIDGAPLRRFWYDRRRGEKTKLPVETMQAFIRAIVTEGHTKGVWLTKPPRVLPDGTDRGYALNDYDDLAPLIQPLVDYGFIEGRSGDSRKPGKLLTTDPRVILEGLGLPLDW